MGADHSRWLHDQTPFPPENQLFEVSTHFEKEVEDDAPEAMKEEDSDLSVKFEYVCKNLKGSSSGDFNEYYDTAEDSSREDSPISWPSHHDSHPYLLGNKLKKSRNSSFSSLSGAALSANATLANTTVCNNMIGSVVLPVLDSPRYFRKLAAFPSSLSSSSSDGVSSHSQFSSSLSPSKSGYLGIDSSNSKNSLSNSAPDSSSSFLYSQEIQTAGGAAGEDRVQAVCSEENGLLFCGIYDGFNGRDAADYLAAHLYEKVGMQLRFLDLQQCFSDTEGGLIKDEFKTNVGENTTYGLHKSCSLPIAIDCMNDRCCRTKGDRISTVDEGESLSDNVLAYQRLITNGLRKALRETETDFFDMVEQEMDVRSYIPMVGSCVLATLIHGQDLFTVNLGDSRAILATESLDSPSLCATSLTEIHTLDNLTEKNRVCFEHPDDPTAVIGKRVKGKLRVTRAFGAGYLKSCTYNDSLFGILRVRNLQSPPYISSEPYLCAHRIRQQDRFVIAASDGLFDFFTNQEVVDLVWKFISKNPMADPASYMLDLLIQRAAKNACMSVEELKNVPNGRRRTYHDDVTIVIITLGDSPKTNSASLS